MTELAWTAEDQAVWDAERAAVLARVQAAPGVSWWNFTEDERAMLHELESGGALWVDTDELTCRVWPR